MHGICRNAYNRTCDFPCTRGARRTRKQMEKSTRNSEETRVMMAPSCATKDLSEMEKEEGAAQHLEKRRDAKQKRGMPREERGTDRSQKRRGAREEGANHGRSGKLMRFWGGGAGAGAGNRGFGFNEETLFSTLVLIFIGFACFVGVTQHRSHVSA
ncbi:hypothetical protein BHM03_00022886 [Ensete ventricosum]|nr:hypothetical protein BHM03_00022886 [Ensete ventricosum]